MLIHKYMWTTSSNELRRLCVGLLISNGKDEVEGRRVRQLNCNNSVYFRIFILHKKRRERKTLEISLDCSHPDELKHRRTDRTLRSPSTCLIFIHDCSQMGRWSEETWELTKPPVMLLTTVTVTRENRRRVENAGSRCPGTVQV